MIKHLLVTLSMTPSPVPYLLVDLEWSLPLEGGLQGFGGVSKNRQPTPVFLPGKSHGQRTWPAAVHEVDSSWSLGALSPPPSSLFKRENFLDAHPATVPGVILAPRGGPRKFSAGAPNNPAPGGNAAKPRAPKSWSPEKPQVGPRR